MSSSPRFGLKQLFHVTALVALFAFGIAVAKDDLQTGAMIALSATAAILASVFLRISRQVWVGMAVGIPLSAIWYWWSDTYNKVHPADRFFEFVIYTTWFSVFGITIAILARAVRRK
jgi:hypothetical protein